ncbi:MAG: TIGR04282 family arsenosugar biosynthesis glycosyltransferase [Rhodospirillales bacterium]
MRPRRHVVVFMREPALGAVKHRLAAGIGDVAAWRFYRDTSRAVLRRLAADRRWRTWIAATPDGAAIAPPRDWRRVARVPQGRGDLGVRMDRALRAFAPHPVVVVGSDIPGLAPRHVAAAFRALAAADIVFGPATDGGYWLVGARGAKRRHRAFAGVRWSGPYALSDSVKSLGRHVRIAYGPTLADVDDAAALERRRAISGGAR